MATGPEHYREAENCIKQACAADERGHEAAAAVWISLGQVHATLALAAASALVMGDNGSTPLRAYDAWQEVAGDGALAGARGGTSESNSDT